MKTTDFLRQHDACLDGAKWALSVSTDMSVVWDALIEQGKYEWLVWTVARPGVFSDQELRKMACRFVRETPLAGGRKVWDLLTDERSRRAVEVAERYVEGKATTDELAAAAHAAGAAYSAADADAHAAYFAAWATADANAANATAYAAAHAAYFAAYSAACAERAAAEVAYAAHSDAVAAYFAAYAAAKSAQVKMVAELGNPFKKEKNSD